MKNEINPFAWGSPVEMLINSFVRHALRHEEGNLYCMCKMCFPEGNPNIVFIFKDGTKCQEYALSPSVNAEEIQEVIYEQKSSGTIRINR